MKIVTIFFLPILSTAGAVFQYSLCDSFFSNSLILDINNFLLLFS